MTPNKVYNKKPLCRSRYKLGIKNESLPGRLPIVSLACFLHLATSGCLDYLKMQEDDNMGISYRSPPVIDVKHLSPHPSRLVETISVGKNCKGQVFKVPPIKDRNKEDRLSYLWFIDNKLAQPESFIEPAYRNSAVITLEINEQFLLSHFEMKIPKDFFDRLHVIDFFISDVGYTIPESRLIDDTRDNENEHSDYAYWIVSFSNDPCS